MEIKHENTNLNANRLILHRIYVKSSSFESYALKLDGFQNLVNPIAEMQILSNNYAQDNSIYQVILGLKIEAKHQGNLIWRLQLEQAGFYTIENFDEEERVAVMNGFCMNQLYNYASTVVTNAVVQGGFAPLYLQSMDFRQMYEDKQKESQKVDSLSLVERAQILSKEMVN